MSRPTTPPVGKVIRGRFKRPNWAERGRRAWRDGTSLLLLGSGTRPPWLLTLDFKKEDLWFGLFSQDRWEAVQDTPQRQRAERWRHLFIGLVPAFPLHLQWRLRGPWKPLRGEKFVMRPDGWVVPLLADEFIVTQREMAILVEDVLVNYRTFMRAAGYLTPAANDVADDVLAALFCAGGGLPPEFQERPQDPAAKWAW